ncbi:hypothetical protein PoB_005814400 [Plakobranchus ocellatus]|uniref:Uncharacterized protein n=1 Tax=Plakobranchus ocellatus TaxID=259542 RepID=A0AAV4CFZ7_9GAST|nr:hypothetical protein PoB_005814400 [Plakobranchus ocellatus]
MLISKVMAAPINQSPASPAPQSLKDAGVSLSQSMDSVNTAVEEEPAIAAIFGRRLKSLDPLRIYSLLFGFCNGFGGGARNRNRRVAADLKTDSLSAVPPRYRR